jgi:DNA-binding IclR family transcriptional regulator
VGRIVHYLSHGSAVRLDGSQVHGMRCRAAVVTEVFAREVVALAVLGPSGMFFDGHVVEHPSGLRKGGTWHWPERAGE